jgi:carnitine-CoA ligase
MLLHIQSKSIMERSMKRIGPQSPANWFAGWDIRSLIDQQSVRHAEHVFLVWEPFEGECRSWSYAEFALCVRRFAAGAVALGLNPGDRAIIHLGNCPELLIAWLGCAYAGVVPVTTNIASSHEDLEYFAQHSKAAIVITAPEYAVLFEGISANVRAVFSTGDEAILLGSIRPFADLDADPDYLPNRVHDPMAPFGIQYTSGTTSRPKAVLWTHANALWGAKVSAAHEDLRADDVQLIYMPLFHTNAQVYSVLASLWVGATIVLQPRFSASRFWPVSLKHGCTFTSSIPFCVKALMARPVPERHSYSRWGGPLCDPPTDKAFGIRTIGWWGMTETVTHGIVGSAHHPDAPMAMGRPAVEYDIHVLDENGEPTKPGEVGDLYVGGVRGVSLFLEYAGDPEATAKAFRNDGLFITGDRVRVGENGYLYFADRSKDMLKVSGENVAASEVERVIIEVGNVLEVAVVAKPHRMKNEVPVAFVIAGPSAPGDLCEAIMASCKKRLALFKVPEEIRIVQELPRATLNKIAKNQLRDLLLAEQEQ